MQTRAVRETALRCAGSRTAQCAAAWGPELHSVRQRRLLRQRSGSGSQKRRGWFCSPCGAAVVNAVAAAAHGLAAVETSTVRAAVPGAAAVGSEEAQLSSAPGRLERRASQREWLCPGRLTSGCGWLYFTAASRQCERFQKQRLSPAWWQSVPGKRSSVVLQGGWSERGLVSPQTARAVFQHGSG